MLISVNSANYIYLNSFNLSSAKTAYFYLIYTQFVGICAAFLWIICITKIDTSLRAAKRRTGIIATPKTRIAILPYKT